MDIGIGGIYREHSKWYLWSSTALLLITIAYLLLQVYFGAQRVGIDYPHVVVNTVQIVVVSDFLARFVSLGYRYRRFKWFKYISSIIGIYSLLFIVFSILEFSLASILLSILQSLLLVIISFHTVVLPVIILEREFDISALETKIYGEKEYRQHNKLCILLGVLWTVLVLGTYLGFLDTSRFQLVGYSEAVIVVIISLLVIWASLLIMFVYRREWARELHLLLNSILLTSYIASSFIEQVFYTPSVVFTTGLLEVIVLVLLMDIESAIFEELVVLHHKMYDKLTVIDVILKETPKIIGIEYYSRRYSLYKKEFALRVVDTLIDIFGKTHIPSTIILITWPGSYLQEYLVGNIYMYFTEEIESMSKPMVIHVLNVTRGVSSTTRPIEVMKGVLRYDISFDPVHTAYFIEKVRSEVGGGSIAIIIEDVVGLLMAYGIERVYEVIYSIVRKLTSRDYVIILIPKDIIGSRELYALRNLTSGLLYL